LEIRKEARELTPPHAVRHYTVKEIAKIWNLSADTVVRIFENEPGVIVILATAESTTQTTQVSDHPNPCRRGHETQTRKVR
jgi:hypothetical protein